MRQRKRRFQRRPAPRRVLDGERLDAVAEADQARAADRVRAAHPVVATHTRTAASSRSTSTDTLDAARWRAPRRRRSRPRPRRARAPLLPQDQPRGAAARLSEGLLLAEDAAGAPCVRAFGVRARRGPDARRVV